MKIRDRFILTYWLMVLLFSFAASAQETEGIMNRMFAPGPLMKGHQKLEGSDCLKCHEAGKGINERQCLNCHKDIQKSILQNKGFHGLNKKSCIDCHSDHKGREQDSTTVDEKKFKHEDTGYKLEGKHQTLKCSECHTEKRSQKPSRATETHFFGKQSTCISCHSKDDPHSFKGKWQSQDCNRCHNLKDWKSDLKFDHNKDTSYKLLGKHAETKCSDCHGGPKSNHLKSVYNWPHLAKAECLTCHKNQHGQNLSTRFQNGKCLMCHATDQNTWKVQKFDHQVSGYNLKGKHAEIKCSECHQQPAAVLNKGLGHFRFTGLKKDCLSCHKDQHKNNFSTQFQGNQCLKCHSEINWKIENFNHKVTGYGINGKHSNLQCIECHKQDPTRNQKTISQFNFKGLQSNCLSCHKDEHRFGNYKSQFAKTPNQCTECHTEVGWQKTQHFNHSQTRFTLTGQHEKTTCKECHLLPMPFADGKLAIDDPKAFLKIGVYNFKNLFRKQEPSSQSRSPKQPRHVLKTENVECATCHKSPHLGQFSQKLLAKNCSECHTTQNWLQNKDGSQFDHSKTRFQIDGAHSQVKCNSCHQSQGKKVYKFKSIEQRFCVDCHKSPHEDQFSVRFNDPNGNGSCINCHTTQKWSERLPFDHSKTLYPLKGPHAEVKCFECHKESKLKTAEPFIGPLHVFKFTNQVTKFDPAKCQTCHTDIHQGQMQKDCTSCHSDNALKWKPIQFDHNRQSQFRLIFKHMDLKCADCHKPSKLLKPQLPNSNPVIRYKPINSECMTCHKDFHKGEFGNKCSTCHSERGWRITRDFHKNFTLHGVHFTVECTECHKDGRKLAGQSQSCTVCHQKDDVHGGLLPNCGECHRQQFWENTHFKHSESRFPLRGMHRTIECADCHRGNVLQGLSTSCLSCHQSEATHHGTPLPGSFNDCSQCHHSFTFKR